MGLIRYVKPRDMNLQPLDGVIWRRLAANGTFNLAPLGDKVILAKLIIEDPSDSGGTLTLKDRLASPTTLAVVSATAQGNHEFNMAEIQLADDSAPILIDGLQAVLANCTGTFSIQVGFKIHFGRSE